VTLSDFQRSLKVMWQLDSPYIHLSVIGLHYNHMFCCVVCRFTLANKPLTCDVSEIVNVG